MLLNYRIALRRLPSSYKSNIGIFFLSALILVAVGCSLEKQSGFNRTMQNLTAHYNILFNANEILRLKQEAYATSFTDAYNEILNVYPDTTAQTGTPDKDLEDAIVKANKIISIKEQSHYLGDAYLVLGKARYLEANYFDAVEYFNYVTRSFGKQANLKQEALVWKARGLMYLNQLPLAKQVIDSAVQDINPKKNITADVYATKLQYDIITQNYAEAEEMAKLAIKYSYISNLKLRWTFILGQLQELNLKPADAYESYTRIVKSNASFEMAFNANLNRIRIRDNQNGVKVNKIDLLRALLKNSDNIDFYDQIYYQIGEQQFKAGEIDNALKSYKKSVRVSTKNQNQKGLSYLRIADINFKNKADYANARLYYDSTLNNLSINYPGYQLIRKKADNLQILTRLLETISREDTLQMLASLDEKARDAKIDEMVARKTRQQQQAAIEANAGAANNGAMSNSFDRNNNSSAQNNRTSGSTFYFYNNGAVSQGYNDFKRLWGNRKLEDNWRRSRRSNTGIPTANTGIGSQVNDPDAPVGSVAYNSNNVSAGTYRQDLVKNLPLTPALLQQSNFRIYNAYFEMANFYRDVLEDKKEAIATYETLLARFPQSSDKPSIYYNLYRLYADIDAAKSTDYKNRLLKEYPESVFAKVILDPDYARKMADVDAEFNGFYNQVYDLYSQKQYTQVIEKANDLLNKYPNNRYAAQLYYLKALAAGHMEKLPPFQADLQLIAAKYPQDKLIAPLVNQHLAYIDSNKTEIAARPVVLFNDDPNEIPFTPPVAYQKQTEYRPPYTPSAQNVTPQERLPERDTRLIAGAKTSAPQIQQATTQQPKQLALAQIPLPQHKMPDTSRDIVAQPAPKQKDSIVATPVAAINKAPAVNYIFSKHDSTNYYFVINVASGTTNLASTRFGVGQFNRTRYTRSEVIHHVKSVGDNNQLIYVGRFYTLDDAKDYARTIVPLLPDIMKVPRDKYSFFIITKENLDKLATQSILDSYFDYYQKFY
ncbi:tetratricopeptide repeat protein [Mucilaginibacter rubeus]|uniref:Tetratricopeptide repeat protein n=1 Tax=Mucilaginibacter rubeus TaxID=2027860 RepID=A0A5C1I584_9SPHI|nr:tetratricopeptide repeat protein [Mucilaginibacter rubeus]QEM12578.1 tetratricopeptide repeat protein [Mucilaginibacter rubeus]